MFIGSCGLRLHTISTTVSSWRRNPVAYSDVAEVVVTEGAVMTMEMIAFAALGFVVVAVAVFVAARPVARSVAEAPRSSNPLDHAERILAARYARGIISAAEYERMLSVLRR